MKQKVTILFSLLLLVFINLSCSKDEDENQVPVIDEKNLTACPPNATCHYLFTENADVNPGPGTFTTGNFRVFWSSVFTQGVSAIVYVRAPMTGNSFTLKTSDIVSGKIEISRNCASCLFAASKLVDGYVKGINLTPGKRADQTKWILEAQLISESLYGTPAVRDTVSVKQYFYPNFVYN
ncbi:hypothetical protein OQY15_08440 [Pedobacter sp. MC2016-15]|uniref:hypothetical protein n=1 Tax=Pedobacter sp. MC2016-15 TaxID=2994473 RepID=UPI0022480486|nr:hypothetical protein [Pedobacter sp. MC2016-15]MCX2479118.1 hypothetical protein [Pedobacter sp. MC2016-15]